MEEGKPSPEAPSLTGLGQAEFEKAYRAPELRALRPRFDAIMLIRGRML